MKDEQPGDDVGAQWEAAMRRGDFEGAWRQTDRIELDRRARERTGTFAWTPDHLHWNGAPFDDRDVLVRCNHGLGDTLQFVRFVPLVKARARSVTMLVQPHLVPLLSMEPAFGRVQNGWTEDAPPPHDVEIEIMELAYALRCTTDTLPRDVPYLPVAAIAANAADGPRLDPAALRVGLLWASSDWDPSRSIPLDALAPLADVRGVRFYGLQQGPRAEDARTAPFAIEPLSPRTTAIERLAAALLQLDLLISVDAMVAHLAGALGTAVDLMLLHRADWRWMDGRTDSPWYPTLRLFRQPEPGDWEAVACDVARHVGALAATAARASPYR